MTLDRLIVCSTDCYIVDMSDVPNGSSVHEHTLLNVEELTELNGCRSICASTSPNNTLAVAYGKSIVVSGMDGTATALLEGHTAAVACLTFSSVWEETLISGSHDRTFRLWDLQHNTVKYESRILSAAPLLSLCEQRSPHRITLGFGDGVVRIVSGDEGYKVLREINSAKLMPPDTVEPTQRKVARVSSHPRIVEEIGDGVVADTEKGFSVLSLQCVRGVFLVSTNHALFSIGCSSLEGKLLLSGAGSGMPYEHAAVAHPYLVGVAAFTSALTCHHIHLDTDALLPEQNTEANPLVSVFPREELPKCFFAYSSIFKNTGVLSGPTHGTARRPSAKKGNGNVGNASKIKSSGYAAPKNEPWSVQQSRKKAELQKRRKAAATQRSVGDLVYTAMRGAPCVVQKQHAAPFESCPLHNGAVMAMQYTPDAKHLVTASADQLCCAVRLPVAKYSGEAVAMKGHTAPLTSVGVSHSYGVEQQALITGSLDSTAKLWRPTRSTSPYLTLQKQAEVRACCFMHTDRVAVVASGGNIDFHHFFIDSAVDESDRLTNRYQFCRHFSKTLPFFLQNCGLPIRAPFVHFLSFPPLYPHPQQKLRKAYPANQNRLPSCHFSCRTQLLYVRPRLLRGKQQDRQCARRGRRAQCTQHGGLPRTPCTAYCTPWGIHVCRHPETVIGDLWNNGTGWSY